MKLTRRSFLKGSAVMAAGTAAAGLMANIPVLAEEEAPAKKWNEMPDPILADQIIETVYCPLSCHSYSAANSSRKSRMRIC